MIKTWTSSGVGRGGRAGAALALLEHFQNVEPLPDPSLMRPSLPSIEGS